MRRDAGLLVLDDLQDHVSLLGLDDVGDFAGFQRKGFVFDWFSELAALECAQVPAIGG